MGKEYQTHGMRSTFDDSIRRIVFITPMYSFSFNSINKLKQSSVVSRVLSSSSPCHLPLDMLGDLVQANIRVERLEGEVSCSSPSTCSGAWHKPIQGSFDLRMSSIMTTYFILLQTWLVVWFQKPSPILLPARWSHVSLPDKLW
jgi:hypothetical protein